MTTMVALLALIFGTVVVGSVAAPGTATADTLVLPSRDPFYGSGRDLAKISPGTPLKTRIVQLAYGNKRFPAIASQILFRTTDQFGKPTAAVTTIIEPPVSGPRKVISYHSPYDALGSQCDPSYALRGGNTGRGPEFDDLTIGTLLAQGYTVVVPDYEGLSMRWTMGRESAQTALDSLRAAERHLRLPASTPVGLFGYSGGSVPTGFGADLAPTYAPELNIIGAAAGGVLVQPSHNLPYVNGSAQWAGVIPALMNVYSDVFNLGIRQFLSPKGAAVLAQTQGKCLIDFATKYPGLTDAQLLAPQYPGLLSIPGIPAAFNQNIMGWVGKPRSPMFLGVGNVDGTGDGIMIDGDVQGLATRYCREGVQTQYKSYPKLSHFDAFLPWAPDAEKFLADRFAHRPAKYCTNIPTGNTLGPLPTD
ncbi:lipase family protein [Gordonia jinhuaensis]|uniref:Lipase n=2 Tax=Gordonia jinhuaensis TaxID=1517702 RepID=A0A916X0A1_9ACTN|nr:lipase family protein [Gordonia jinhuaensis]GGB46857.1 lipase [Gordonia jinhuaensis]